MSSVSLKIRSRDDLDGTHRAVLETEYPSMSEWVSQSPHGTAFVKLGGGSRFCCCLVEEVRYSRANVIWVDRFKQQSIGVRDGEATTVECISAPPTAAKVNLRASASLSPRELTRLGGKPVVKGEKTAVFMFSGGALSIRVEDTSPSGIVVIGPQTEVETGVAGDGVDEIPITYKDIGGLEREVRCIREIVEFPLRFPDVYGHLGITQPSGVILYGPPGTGKTLMVRALSYEVGAKFYVINGPEIFSKWYGESERQLREIFEEAGRNAPSVILIDELDSLVPKRGTGQGELEQRVVASFLTLMDGVKKRKGVVVIGTTNRINSIDPALRREGRFGQEVHVGVPDTQGRKQIFHIHTKRMPLAADVQIDALAKKTVGFVGADIESLCRQAAYSTLRRSFSWEDFEKGKVVLQEDLRVSQADFESALPGIPPSAMRELLVEIPKVSWNDIGGLQEVKRLLKENITYAISKREAYQKAGVKPARGILLYGPPGTGKTLLAKAVATECEVNFISVKGPEMRSKWLGESEERIRFLFSKAREVSPCVIFFDEIDAAAPARGRDATSTTDTIVNQILCEMDGIEGAEGVFVIGATNRAELLDAALLRPGRFDYQVEVPLPDPDARRSILQGNLKGKPLSGVDIEQLIVQTEGFSGADIAEVCRQSAMAAVRDAKYEPDEIMVKMHHLLNAIAEMQRTKTKLAPKVIGFHSRSKNAAGESS